MSQQQSRSSGPQEQGECSSSEKEESSKQISNPNSRNIETNKQPKKTAKIKKDKKAAKSKKSKKFKMTSTSFKSKKCQFYNKGSCSKGNQCTFSHNFQPQSSKKICKFYLSGACTKAEICPFSHNTKTYPCRFYHLEKICKNGVLCRFSHQNIKEDMALEYLQDNQEFLVELFKKKKLTDSILLTYVRNSKLLEKEEQKYDGKLAQPNQSENQGTLNFVKQKYSNAVPIQEPITRKENNANVAHKNISINVNDPRIKRKLQAQKINKQTQKSYTQNVEKNKNLNQKFTFMKQQNQFSSIKALKRVGNNKQMFKQSLIAFFNSYY